MRTISRNPLELACGIQSAHSAEIGISDIFQKKKFLLPLPQRTQGLNGRFLKRRISPFQFVGWIHRHLFMQPTGNAVMILRHPPQKEEKLPVPAGALIMAVNNKIRPNSFTVALHFVRNRRITSLSIHNKFFQVSINLNI